MIFYKHIQHILYNIADKNLPIHHLTEFCCRRSARATVLLNTCTARFTFIFENELRLIYGQELTWEADARLVPYLNDRVEQCCSKLTPYHSTSTWYACQDLN